MTQAQRTPGLATVCAVALATVLAAPTMGLAGQVTNKAHQTFSTLSAAVAVAKFNDTLTVTGSVSEPGPVVLAGFTGKIQGSGPGASVSQGSPGACGGIALNCVFDASGAGPVSINNLTINVPSGAIGILGVAQTGLPVSKNLTVTNCNLTGPALFSGIVLEGVSGGQFTFQNNTISGPISNGINVLDDGVHRLFVSAHNNLITNTGDTADTVGILVGFGPPTVSNTVAIFNNTVDGGGSSGAFAGIDVVLTDRAQIHDNVVRNFLGGTPNFDNAPGAGIRLRAATNIMAHDNTLLNNRIAIQIDPIQELDEEVSNNVKLRNNEMQSTLDGANGLIFNAGGNIKSLYSGPVDARDNEWGPGHLGPNSADGSCSCGPTSHPPALSVINDTPGIANVCNNTPSASGGDVLSCPSD